MIDYASNGTRLFFVRGCVGKPTHQTLNTDDYFGQHFFINICMQLRSRMYVPLLINMNDVPIFQFKVERFVYIIILYCLHA